MATRFDEATAALWRANFVRQVSEGTGIPKLVVWAWVLAEGGPKGNPLNIGPGRDYGGPSEAARATVELLRHPRYAPILRAARTGNDAAVLAAIIASPWDAGHYRGGDLLRGTYERAKRENLGNPAGEGIVERTVGAITDPITEPIERAVGSVETFLVERSKLALAYVGLTAAAVVLFVLGLQLATGVGSMARQAGLAAAGARAGRGEIPF